MELSNIQEYECHRSLRSSEKRTLMLWMSEGKGMQSKIVKFTRAV